MKFANVGVAIIAIWLALASLVAHGQTYPAKPVRIIVGFAAGGQTDIPVRIVASKLGDLWGTGVIVENRTGAGGRIAADMVAKAPADGYTLLACTTATHGINPALYKQLPYDPIKDFTPISQFGTSPSVLLVHPAVPINSVLELLAYAKAKPGGLSVATAGTGTSQYLAFELLKLMTGANIVQVPYKGGAPAIADLIGGQVPAMISGLPTALAWIKSGKVRALGVTSTTRSPQAPEVPAIAESGVPGFEVVAWLGFCAPAGLPKPLLAKLNADVRQVLSMPDTEKRLAEHGVDAKPTTSEQFDAHIKSEIAKWTKVVKEAGITAE